jgi:hypothetical protein
MPGSRPLLSVGRPLAGMQIRVRDEAGGVLAPR